MWPMTTPARACGSRTRLEVADDALAQVEEDGGRAPLDEIAGGRRRRVGRGGAAAEHGQSEPLAQDVAHGRHARAGRHRSTASGRPRGLSRSRHLSTRPDRPCRMARCRSGRRSSARSPPSRSSAGWRPTPSSAWRRRCARAASAGARSSSTSATRATPCSSSSAARSRSRCHRRPATRPSWPPCATGDVFGELALLDGAPRSASATALSPTETVVLPRDRFRELIATEAGVRDALLASIAGELRRLTTHVEELHFLDITGRLAAQLVRLAREGGTPAGRRRDPAAHQPDPGRPGGDGRLHPPEREQAARPVHRRRAGPPRARRHRRHRPRRAWPRPPVARRLGVPPAQPGQEHGRREQGGPGPPVAPAQERQSAARGARRSGVTTAIAHRRVAAPRSRVAHRQPDLGPPVARTRRAAAERRRSRPSSRPAAGPSGAIDSSMASQATSPSSAATCRPVPISTTASRQPSASSRAPDRPPTRSSRPRPDVARRGARRRSPRPGHAGVAASASGVADRPRPARRPPPPGRRSRPPGWAGGAAPRRGSRPPATRRCRSAGTCGSRRPRRGPAPAARAARGRATSGASRGAARAGRRRPGRRSGARPASRARCRSGWAAPCRRDAPGLLAVGSAGTAASRRAHRPRSQASSSGSTAGSSPTTRGDGLAGEVVRGRTQPAGRDHEVDPLERAGEGLGDDVEPVGQGR